MRKGHVIDTIKNRRSVRSYLSVQIPDKDLVDIIESSVYAPSGKNRQPWRFVIIKDCNVIKAIAKATV